MWRRNNTIVQIVDTVGILTRQKNKERSVKNYLKKKRALLTISPAMISSVLEQKFRKHCAQHQNVIKRNYKAFLTVV